MSAPLAKPGTGWVCFSLVPPRRDTRSQHYLTIPRKTWAFLRGNRCFISTQKNQQDWMKSAVWGLHVSPWAWLVSIACTSPFGPDERFMKKDLSSWVSVLPAWNRGRPAWFGSPPRSLSFPLASCHCLWQSWGGCGSPGKGGTFFSCPPYQLFVAVSGIFQPIYVLLECLYTHRHTCIHLYVHTPLL